MKSGNAGAFARAAATLTLLSLSVATACKSENRSTDSQAVTKDSGASPAKPAKVAGAKDGFDSCLIGNWKAKQVTVRSPRVFADGGAGITMAVSGNGSTRVDFDGMSPVLATATPTTFEFRYSGQATAKLVTPGTGALSVEKPEYSKVLVTAQVSIPGAGKIELFKQAPLSDLEKVGKAGEQARDELPLPEPSGPPPETIDAKPIFSSSAYSCAGDTLKFMAGEKSAAWEFNRVR